MLKLAVFVIVVFYTNLVISCPTQCYCTDTKMTCSKVVLKEDDLMSLQIPMGITDVKLLSNELDHISEGSMANFRNLKRLEISKNKISSIPIFTFRGFKNLVELKLNENEITEITEGSFIGLENLLDLELQYNRISFLQAGVFDKLKSIYSIRMQDNMLQSIRDVVFSPLNTLRKLYLTRNKIVIIHDHAFRDMKMSFLSLSTNQIEVIPRTAFEGFEISNRILFLDNPLDCSCKNAMNYMVNFQGLKDKILGHCKTPQNKLTRIMEAYKHMVMCSLCDLDPCQNGGKCSGDKTQFKCECPERFKGKQCELNICSGYVTPDINEPDRVPLRQINHTEFVIVKEKIDNDDDAKKLKILYAMCSFEFIVIICFVIYFMWKRYEEWKLQKQYEHEKSRAILFSIRNQTNAQLAKALVEENEEFPADLKNMILNGSVPV